MKKIIFLIAFFTVTFAANAQYDLIKRGIKIGAGGTKTLVDSTELKRIKEIDEKVSIADLVTPTSFDTVLVTAKATAPTKAAGTNTNDVATMNALQEATLPLKQGRIDNMLKRLTGATFISPVMAWTGINSTQTLVDGERNYTIYEVTDTVVVSKFSWVLSVQGSYTADNNNKIGLFSYNPTTKVYTKIIETANDGNLWKSSADVVQEVSFTPQVLVPGFYAVCVIWNASSHTTAPVMRSFGTFYPFSTLFYAHRLNAIRTGQTDLAATVENYSDLSSGGNIVGIYLK